MGGIYKIYFKGSKDKFYIGRTSNFIEREQAHLYLLKINKHHSVKLQKEYNKKGLDDFRHAIISITDDIERQIRIEQIYLNGDTAFNMSKSSKGGRRPSTIKHLKNLSDNEMLEELGDLINIGDVFAIKYYFKLMYGNPKKLTEDNRLEFISKFV